MREVRAILGLTVAGAMLVACGPAQAPPSSSSSPERHAPSPTASSPEPSVPAADGLVWSAEFDGAAGEPLDPDEWSVSDRGDGYGNDELQVYTPRAENVYQDGEGVLRLIAREESFTDPRGFSGEYTSGRIETKTRFEHGRVEARVKAPVGAGFWSAFWLFGDSLRGEDWPEVGEIDIFELIGNTLDLHNAVIAADEDGQRWIRNTSTYTGAPWGGTWRVYALEWDSEVIVFTVDDLETYRVARTDLAPTEQWPFDRPYSITLNLAIGGWPGEPTEETVFPAEFQVDYVRVYDARVVPAR